MNKYMIEINVCVDDSDLVDILTTALEGGITYWCSDVEIFGNRKSDVLTEQVILGGGISLNVPREGKFVLTKTKLIEGVKLYLRQDTRILSNVVYTPGINVCGVDIC